MRMCQTPTTATRTDTADAFADDHNVIAAAAAPPVRNQSESLHWPT